MNSTVATGKPAWACDLPDRTPDGDPIVYGAKALGPRIVKVGPLTGYRLFVSFDNGEARLFDVSPLMSRGVFRRLLEPEAFTSLVVVNEGGGVAWASGPDLSAETLFHRGAIH